MVKQDWNHFVASVEERKQYFLEEMRKENSIRYSYASLVGAITAMAKSNNVPCRDRIKAIQNVISGHDLARQEFTAGADPQPADMGN